VTLSRAVLALLRRTLRLFGQELVPTHQVPERTLAGLQATEFALVFDIGANRGDFLHWSLRRYRFLEMHCFEPLPEPFAELQSLARRSSRLDRRVWAHNVALGDRAEDAIMFAHREHLVSSSLLATTARTLELFPQAQKQQSTTIRTERLDDFVAQHGIVIAHPTLVKMDVQGFENRVIEGGLKVLAQCHVLIIEINFERLYEGQASFREIFLALDELGFEYRGNLDQLYANDGKIISCDCMFVSSAFGALSRPRLGHEGFPH